MKSLFSGSASWAVILGASLFWTWQDSAVFGTSLYAMSVSQSVVEFAFVIVFIANILSLIAVFAISRKDDPRFMQPLVMLGFAVAGSIGCLINVFAAADSNLYAIGAGSTLIGISIGYMIVAWGFACVAQGPKKALIHIAAAWALGLPFNLLIAALRPETATIFVSALPTVSGLVFFLLKRAKQLDYLDAPRTSISASFPEEARRVVAGVDLRFLIIVLVFCAVFGLMYHREVLDPTIVLESNPISIIGVRCITALLFLIAALTVLRRRMDMVFWVCLSVMAAGALAMTVGVFSPEARQVGQFLVSMGYSGFDILVWVMIAFYCQGRVPAPRIAALVMLAEQVGILFGAVVGIGVKLLNLEASSEIILVAALSYLMVLALMALSRYYSRIWSALFDPSNRSSQQANEGDALQDLAAYFKLTPRETEILELFISGRSMPYIAEKMVVSENTVKTHIRHTYTKLGINNRQELLDLAEAYHKAE